MSRSKYVLWQDKMEYIINESIVSAVKCTRCGGPTRIAPSVFIEDKDVLQCIGSCYSAYTEREAP